MNVNNPNINNPNNSNQLGFLGLSNIINTKSKTFTGDRFYVGEGVLKCDNYFISLDSICMVEAGRKQNSLASFILTVIMGIIICVLSLFLCIINVDVGISGIFIGILIIAMGILGIYFIRKANEKIPYSLVIHLNDNSSYAYDSLNKKFVIEVMEVIQSCINDRRGGYNIMMNQGKIEHITNNGGKFIYASDNATVTDSSREQTIINNNSNAGLTAEDWMNLEKYLLIRQQELPKDDKNYKICNNLLAYSHKKDASTIKRYLLAIGKEAVKILFTASTNIVAMQTVRPIINKILSIKE